MSDLKKSKHQSLQPSARNEFFRSVPFQWFQIPFLMTAYWEQVLNIFFVKRETDKASSRDQVGKESQGCSVTVKERVYQCEEMV